MDGRTLLSSRVTERFVAVTGHVTEHDVEMQSHAHPEYPDMHWVETDALDAGLAMRLEHRVARADFSANDF